MAQPPINQVNGSGGHSGVQTPTIKSKDKDVVILLGACNHKDRSKLKPSCYLSPFGH